jgi:alpha-L-rhamnosidase
MSVERLTCEHLQDPLGIDVAQPRFSWQIADRSYTSGQCQTAYHIVVASSPKLLDSPDVWDSGITPSSESHLVTYGGAALQSGSDYYWKVRIYDRYGKPSKWSAIAHFSTGLFDSAAWKGDWIKHPSATSEQHIWFRKKIALDAAASSAFVHVASMGYHELYVNGKKADERVLAPALVRLDKRTLYVTYDVKALLRKGDNVIAVWYAPGWSRYNFWAARVEQAWLLQMNGSTVKGGAFTLHSDESWKCEESYSRNAGKFEFFDMGGEEVNGQRYRTDWNTATFDDSRWQNARKTTPLKNGAPIALAAQMVEPSRIIESIPAQAIAGIDTLPGVWRAVMAKTFTGFLKVRFNGLHKGDTVRIRVTEKNNKIDQFKQTQYYIARGEDGETFENRFNYFSGRYIYFDGLKQPPAVRNITGYAVTSAPQRTGWFECSDTMYNRIHEMDKWTYEMCTTEGYTSDCPHRERLGYGSEGAYQTQWGAGLPCFATGAFYLKNVRDWSDMQTANGWVHNTAPQINRMYGGAIYGAANMNMAWEHYLSYADKKSLEECYPTGKRWLEFLNTWVRHDMLTPYDTYGWFLGDWLGPGPRQEYGETTEALFFNNCIYAITLDLFIRIAEELGRHDETAPYRERLHALKATLHDTYFVPGTNSYLNGDQVRTSLALYAGIVPDSLRNDVLNHLHDDMTGAHPYFDIGSPSRYPYFKTLLAYPELFHQTVADILSTRTYPSYGHFLELGETTFPEAWEAGNDAHVHTSYVGISAWLIKGLAGIEPLAPGYRTVTIRPQPAAQLSYAKAAVQSPYGIIESGWKKHDGNITYRILIPVGVQAKIYIPAAAPSLPPTLHEAGAGIWEFTIHE